MTQDHASATQKPHLDDLLTVMGITREQLMGMTADDLFAAATRWQDAATIAAAEAKHFAPVDRLLEPRNDDEVGSSAGHQPTELPGSAQFVAFSAAPVVPLIWSGSPPDGAHGAS